MLMSKSGLLRVGRSYSLALSLAAGMGVGILVFGGFASTAAAAAADEPVPGAMGLGATLDLGGAPATPAVGAVATGFSNPAANPDRAYHLLSGARFAQFDADDTYDPFADYSEFDEAQEEEADINFFRNGRFVTLGFIGGMRGFTGGLGSMYQSSPAFGVFLSYFFDLRFAMQFSFLTSDHSFHVASKAGNSASGTIGITSFAVDFKYFVNTQNVTKGLAAFNPYIIAGFARVDRTTNIENVQGFGKEGAMAFDLGAGIELPLLKNKMFFGAQAMYQLINFQDENTEIIFDNNDRTGKYPNGDSFTVLGILGVNF